MDNDGFEYAPVSDALGGTDDKLADSEGTELPRSDVEEMAFGNIMASMSHRELINAYMEYMDDATLIEWASDSEGRFTE